MADVIDPVLFRDLEGCDPKDVIARTGCAWDQDTGSYQTRIWGTLYQITPGRCRVQALDQLSHGEYMHLFILHYLMKAMDILPAGTLVSEKDIPSGAAFFRGPHTLPTHLMVDAFKNNLGALEETCLKLGGKPLNMADLSYIFEITPKIPVAVLYWAGDQDFAAEARLLFDKTIGLHLPLDIVYALAVQVCRTISEKNRNRK
jgi:hypothetical protein